MPCTHTHTRKTERHKINIIPLLLFSPYFLIVVVVVIKPCGNEAKDKNNSNNNTHLKLPKDAHTHTINKRKVGGGEEKVKRKL